MIYDTIDEDKTVLIPEWKFTNYHADKIYKVFKLPLPA